MRTLLFCGLFVLTLSCSSDATTDSVAPIEADSATNSTGTFQLPAPAGVNADGELLSLEVVDSDAVTGLITDHRGFAVYGVRGETVDNMICTDSCIDSWKPLPPRAAAVADRLESELYRVVTRPDGIEQVVYADIPLYLWTGDSDVGIPRGVGVAGIWFALTADGSAFE